ncbi:APC family permease [Ponticoccus sp. SC2-23]|jgi:amino acid transporter|uniref:APC family permease n=1 Tax=Alexandriicola marinus TaxID=2081710 RepID=UPI000FD8232E|nr:APC family permease [Alexandriicola marinus]MBM1222648.1 APC family permease [Ponticoccus sp. SC6-9]MBM1227152.1 APC family permease [Ponticoccus sp. SC6-15]MBM1231574.1 APC family permease [Ponticoccus sp. SC6-38]MBM1236161.1 APC family permease [Ponticoccus sp. SC6-45]MBM1240597.1 APC family permease [Ponticoccus sp. SC6-49]MBM1245132.1 APC family permease [Ponticoccus sp. SC2-64]MBM1249622.1 APC family permease [Ponticoccus sp. SC6-42]MBM1254104.1 APC family permease [Ponticoccus sp. 
MQSEKETYRENSISLGGAVAMGTGVMIGAGIFALTGQIAQLAGPLFPLAFIAGAVVTSFSAYSYIRMSNKWPSSGGIAMILQKCYGPGAIAGGAALLMALSMVIAESLVARTFATYVLRPFDIEGGPLVPALAVAVIVFAFLVNMAGNRSVGLFSLIMAAIKIGGIALFGIAALWSSGFAFAAASETSQSYGLTGFIASTALAILAFKGFTTITNSGAEITEPNRNVGRAIMFSIGICVVVYLLVAYGVGSSLTIEEIISARDYSLAQAAQPALGQTGFILTVILAAVATASGVLASVFAVSRMLAMLTDMEMIPHSHFGMPGPIQRHTLVYTVVIAATLAVLFDLGRIASLGAFFYLVMDMIIHWGVFRYRRADVGAFGIVLLTALALDAIVLAAFTVMKLQSDPMIVLYAAVGMIAVFAFERVYLSQWVAPQVAPAPAHAHAHGD